MIKKLSRPELLSIAGLGFLAAAAWTIHYAAGLAAVGLALLLLEWRIDKP